MNFKLYFTNEDYNKLAGPDWPSYESMCAGVSAKNPEIQKEIDGYIDMFRKDGTKFPIDTATACQSKWTWSTIYLNQLSSASCHRVQHFKFEFKDFDNFHNTPEKITARKKMLQGEWPGLGCEYCKNIESAGGHSDRQHNLEIRGLTPWEVELDVTATHVTPKIVEIFAQNTCNLACVYCNGNLSSKIEQENKKYGSFKSQGVSIPVITTPTEAAEEYFVKFLDWTDKNIQELRRLHLLGGETFLQRRLMEGVLDIIERRPNSELRLCIFSNFNTPDSLWYPYLERIQLLQQRGHIKQFDLTASIDCWGAEAEYTRSGLDLVEFEKKFAWAAEQNGTWLTLFVNQTLTPLTIRAMPELIEKIIYYSNGRHIAHYWEMYIGNCAYLHPNIFSYSFWENDFARIFATMPDSNTDQHEAVVRMQGIQAYLKQFTQNNSTQIKNLHIYLDELDRRRGTNWRQVFPYLDI